ncbi:MAG: hypothetical protein IJT60_04445 [Clostridia bacterium]|nr:hypothetical protein [Clostridia bacterium]
MRILKTLGLLLCFVLILSVLLCACSSQSSDPQPGESETGKDSQSESQQDAGGKITIVSNGKTDYQVIRSDIADATVTSMSLSVKNALSTMTGEKVGIVTDYEAGNTTEHEIIIGQTTRPESETVSQKIGDDDYRIEVVGEKVVIVGKDNRGLAQGVKYFLNEILGYRSVYDYNQQSDITIDSTFAKGAKVSQMTPTDPRNSADILIYTVSVTDFGAIGDGLTDDTNAFQKALNEVKKQGGGTVFAPAGQYLIKGSLTVGRSCYLAGEWTDPQADPEDMHKGTVLLATGSKGSDSRDKSLITIGASAGVLGITVFYPEQSADSIQKYPPTLRIKDNIEGDGSQHAASIQNVTLVNSYCGISADEGLQLPTLSDIYMTALQCGFRINKCYDCARINTIVVTPQIWSSFSSISLEKVSALMRENTTGLLLQRTDMQMMYGIYLESCHVGIHLSRNKEDAGETAGYSALVKVEIKDSVTGILDEFNSVSVSDASISCNGTGAVCVKVGEETKNESVLRFYDVVFSNPDGQIIEIEDGACGIISAQNSVFKQWGVNSYAVSADGGVLSIINSRFSGSGDAIYVGTSVRGASIESNTFDGTVTKPLSTSVTGDKISFSDTGSYEEPRTYAFQLTVPPVVTNSQTVYNVKDYGAKGDGTANDTQAFLSAISAASKGGIVYVPAGRYVIQESLSIPTGVELRGISESMHVSSGEGSVLLVEVNRGQADAEAFITLSERSSVRGIMLWYPEQAWNDLQAFPFAIAAEGKNCVIRNICLGNCYRGIDLASADCGGHFVENISGAVLNRGIVLDGSSSAGVIRNTHFNLTFYTNLSRNTKLTDASGDFMGSSMFSGMLSLLNQQLTAYEFGETVGEELLFVFNYRAKYGMIFTGGFDGTIVGCAVDGSLCGVKITGSYDQTLSFLAFSDDIVPGGTAEGNLAVYINTDQSSEVHFAASGASSYNYVPSGLVHLENGNLILDGFDARVTPESGKGAIRCEKGEALLNGIVFQHVGRLNAQGAFTPQSSSAQTVDIYVAKTGMLETKGLVGVNFFNAKILGSGNADSYAVAK